MFLVRTVATNADPGLLGQFRQQLDRLTAIAVIEHLACVSFYKRGPPLSGISVYPFEQFPARGKQWKPDVKVVEPGIVLLLDAVRQVPYHTHAHTLAAFARRARLKRENPFHELQFSPKVAG